MSRSKWKGPFVDTKFFDKINSKKTKNTIKTLSRDLEITPKIIGLVFEVHNGKSFSKIEITEDKIGFKLGEFSPTRKKYSFKKKK